jgi:hypothetical protein
MSSARLNRHHGTPASHSAGGEPDLTTLNKGHATSRGELSAPPVDQELIDYLKKVFQVRLSEHYDIRVYDRMLGAQQVIENLQKLHDIQNNQ